MSEFIGKHVGDFYIVTETTPIGRAQVALGRREKVFDVPSPVCANLYEPVPVPLGKGESVVVYDAKGNVVMQS